VLTAAAVLVAAAAAIGGAFYVRALQRAAARQYQALFEQNPQPVFVWEPGTGRILAANHSACDAYGFSREELLSMSAFDLRVQDPQSQMVPLPAPGTVVERTHRRRDGSLREGEVHTTAIRWRGTPAMLTLVVDVTERNRTQRHAASTARSSD
jgi:PAS domain S-box-containing protein